MLQPGGLQTVAGGRSVAKTSGGRAKRLASRRDARNGVSPVKRNRLRLAPLRGSPLAHFPTAHFPLPLSLFPIRSRRVTCTAMKFGFVTFFSGAFACAQLAPA